MKSEYLYNTIEIRCYDNGGKTFDRYTVVYMGEPERKPGTFAALGMSEHPYHPQGFGQHCQAMPGARLGRRIRFAGLPTSCQNAVIENCFASVPDFLEFASAYIEAALRSSTDMASDGNTVELEGCELHPDTRRAMHQECLGLLTDYADDLKAAVQMPGYGYEQAGHDFWLTRNGHGAGFWDRGLGEVGDRLSEYARQAGSRDLYLYRGKVRQA